MIYTSAQYEDGTPLRVTEECEQSSGGELCPHCEWCVNGARTDLTQCPEAAPCPQCSRKGTRPASWALILPGDVVIWHARDNYEGGDQRATVLGVAPEVMGDKDGPIALLLLFDDGGSEWLEPDVTLLCTANIPEHRAGNPAWQWPKAAPQWPAQPS